jgi:hypothetical protein
MGEGSSGSREAEGNGGEDFYIAQSGRRPNLLVSSEVGVRLVEEREGMKSKGKQLTLIISRDAIGHQDLIKL